jgi:hypothetical protein
MIEKVARSTALRRAYPEDFAGIYDPAEMGSAAHVEPEHAEQTPARAPAALPPRTVEAEIVKPEPAPEPKKEPKKSGVSPPHVVAAWTKLVKQHAGNKTLAKAEWDHAAGQHFGDHPKPSSEWTPEETNAVRAIIWPDDVPF